MSFNILHGHSKEEARIRIEKLILHSKREYYAEIKQLKIHWEGYKFYIEVSARGYTISGSGEIKDRSVTLKLSIPFLLKIFTSQINSAVHEKVANAFL